ncbi:uncharacterized protein LOC141588038 [Silene latifolia]|uniref:uncharacterized protein LOC141588038 n=1 Tax=Silene latifolia TaxID=37657 RepID=UPI003D775D79
MPNVESPFSFYSSQNVDSVRLLIVAPLDDDWVDEVVVSTDEGEIEFWSTAVFCYILGARPPLNVVNGFITRVWKGFNIDKISFMKNGIFIVRFASKEHQQQAIGYGPLMFDSKPVIIKEWKPDASLVKHNIQCLPIWVKIQDLDIKFLGENCLRKIIGPIGSLIKCDENTMNRNFLSFPRLLIEVSMEQDFPEEVIFVDECGSEQTVQLEYEWLPLSCSKWKGIGHSEDQCRTKPLREGVKKV